MPSARAKAGRVSVAPSRLVSALWSLVYTEPGTYRAASGRTQLPSPGEHAAPPPYRGPNPHSNQRAGGRGVSSLLRLYAYRSAFTALSLRSFLHLGSLQTSCPCGEDPGVWSCLSGPWRRLHGLQHHPELTSGFHWRHAFGKTVGFYFNSELMFVRERKGTVLVFSLRGW